LNELAGDAIPFAVHFRYATHGDVTRENVHPFPIPGTDAMLMHNGVLWTSAKATKEKSDTRVFCDDVAPKYFLGVDCPKERRAGLEKESQGNRLLLMLGKGEAWEVLNKHLWTERHGCWYSNTYSIAAMQPRRVGYHVSRALPVTAFDQRSWEDQRDLTVIGERYPDGDTFIQSCDSDMLWDAEYDMWVKRGYTPEDAEIMADDYIDHVADDLDAARDEQEYAAAYSEPSRSSGFDWHDTSTWTRYPIPGTEHRESKPTLVLPKISWKKGHNS
jgi:hypothetical protein